MKKKTWIVILIAAIVLIGVWLLSSYNNLVSANEAVDGQWAQVESQYQRRFDLIPNLVAAVKGNMDQEQAVFGDLAAARANYSGANTTNAKAEAATQLEGALSRLLVVMENYPELRSSEAVQTLMAQLEGTENRISVERNRYNDTVKSYNVMTKRFPLNLVANIFNYQEKAYFQINTPEAANAPVVNLELAE